MDRIDRLLGLRTVCCQTSTLIQREHYFYQREEEKTNSCRVIRRRAVYLLSPLSNRA